MMCKWGTDTKVKLCETRYNSVGKPYDVVFVDKCISGIIQALNDAGIMTIASCCGHGKIDGSIILEDGRELVVREDINAEFSPSANIELIDKRLRDSVLEKSEVG